MKDKSLEDLVKRDKKLGRVSGRGRGGSRGARITGIDGRNRPLAGRGRGGAHTNERVVPRRERGGIRKHRPQEQHSTDNKVSRGGRVRHQRPQQTREPLIGSGRGQASVTQERRQQIRDLRKRKL